ncbi:MAG: hypothetical protein MUC49_22350 [Raineya sp.]|jgi:hypothetical protein|nr:hypothetical protein [Raineya sp.]
MEENASSIGHVQLNKQVRQIKARSNALIIAFVIGFVILGGFIYFSLQQLSQRIYVLGYGGTYFATAHDGKSHTDFEVENFVKVFMKTMYGHDATTFKSRVEKALQYVSKKDGQAIVDDFNRERLHEQYIRSGASIRVEVDSILIDMRSVPYTGIAFSRQIVYNGSREAVVPFGMKFKVGMLPRSSTNPFGLQLRDLNFFKYELNLNLQENQDIQSPSEKEKELSNMEENLEEKTDTKSIKMKEPDTDKKSTP